MDDLCKYSGMISLVTIRLLRYYLLMLLTGLLQDFHGTPNHWRRSTTGQEAGIDHVRKPHEIALLCAPCKLCCGLSRNVSGLTQGLSVFDE